MGLTPIQHRDIMNEYDQIRRDNYQTHQARIEEIYSRIPEIKEIDDAISRETIATARKMIFKPDETEKEKLHQMVEDFLAQKKSLLRSNGYPEDYLEPIYRCPTCKDTGYVDDRKCFCFEHKILDIMYKQSNLMDSIAENNFSTFNINYYSNQISPGQKISPRDNMLNVLDESYSFIRNFSKNPGANLLLNGNPGVGKTFLTTCIASEIIKSGKSVVYLTSYQLFEQLANYTFHRKEHTENTLPMILDTDLLIIDDLGTEMNNSFVNSQLFLCINERILSKKSTIISTNFSLNQLSKVYTERISSRLIQFYTILHIYGDDIRIKRAFSTID